MSKLQKITSFTVAAVILFFVADANPKIALGIASLIALGAILTNPQQLQQFNNLVFPATAAGKSASKGVTL